MDRPSEYRILFEMMPDRSVDPETGFVIASPETSVNFIPYPIKKGCRIIPRDRTILFRIFFYSPEIPGELIHVYCYQEESNWTTFRPDLSAMEWEGAGWTAPEDGYVRAVVNLSSCDLSLPDLFLIEDIQSREYETPDWMVSRADVLDHKVITLRKPGDLVLMLLTDTHYAVNGIWQDTLESLRMCGSRIHPDAVIHLGDFTDGLLPGKLTRAIVRSMIADLESICGKFWGCVGNHDVNYFRDNPDRFSQNDCAELYLRRKAPRYVQDIPEKDLRLIFLDSFDPEEKERYGFSKSEVLWFMWTLFTTPKHRRVIIFSHVPPSAEIHVWSKTIRNGEMMLKIAERFHKCRGDAVLGWIHGHNHADLIWWKRCFPVIGIGCSKLEDFRDHKPDNSLTFDRIRGTESQELWDLLLVHADDGSMDFLRFGAGSDRHVALRMSS